MTGINNRTLELGLGTQNRGRIDALTLAAREVNGFLEVDASVIADYAALIERLCSDDSATVYVPISDAVTPVESDNPFSFHQGLVTVDPNRRLVTVGDSLIDDLSFKEFELLHFLGSNAGVVFDRPKIMYEVWGADFVGNNRTIDVHTRRIRARTDLPTVIRTHRGTGYSCPV